MQTKKHKKMKTFNYYHQSIIRVFTLTAETKQELKNLNSVKNISEYKEAIEFLSAIKKEKRKLNYLINQSLIYLN